MAIKLLNREALYQLGREFLKQNPDIAGVIDDEDEGVERKLPFSPTGRTDARYPWSAWQQHELLALGRGDIDSAVSNVWSEVLATETRLDPTLPSRVTDEVAEMAQRGLYAFARWIRSDRMLISVSTEAQKVLSRVLQERVEQGLSPARWRDLPSPGSPLYAKGIMFIWEGQATITYACPYGLTLHEHTEFVEWQQRLHKEHRLILWATRVLFPFTVSRQWYETKEEQLIEALRDEVPKDAEFSPDDITVETFREFGGADKHFGSLLHTVNVLAAMNSGVELVNERKARTKQGKRKHSVGGLRGVKSLQLDESGLYTWSRKFVTLPSDVPTGHGSPGEHEVDYPDDRRPPCLHHVDQHLMTLWVREPKADEEICDIKEGKHGVLYAVKRIRGTEEGYMRGERFRPKQQRLKAGVDDFDTHGSG